jgi:hypothetical protein
MHNEANFSAVSGTMPACTPEEMWEKKTSYAVMKIGGKRAKKIFENKVDAESLISTLKDHAIETRLGGRTRCESFCQVSKFCRQWIDYQNQHGGNNVDTGNSD